MKREVLEFLKRERDAIGHELARLKAGERRLVRREAGEHDMTPQAIAEAEARWVRFEEMIAAYESGVV